LDNICHALTGAAIAEAGFRQRTRFATPALLIAANLPDIDVLAFVSDTPAVALRRGLTHGPIAQVFLPLLLTAGFVLLDRRTRDADTPRLRPWVLLLASYIGVLTHVGMDWLNNYGVRLLMPLTDRWFYGDAVFIIDPWLWLMLALAVVVSRRWSAPWGARAGLVVATIYIAAMVASAAAARQKVIDAWTQAKGQSPRALMVGPVPVNPFRKTVIIDAGSYYERGTFEWWPTRVRFDPQHVQKNDGHPAAIRAAQTDSDFRAVLIWARFPYYTLVPVDSGTRVMLGDMRFPSRRMFEVATVITTND
jgi:inner membrane protein